MIDTHCHLDFPHFDEDRDEVWGGAGDDRIILAEYTGTVIFGGFYEMPEKMTGLV